jgi:sensor histidine kinase YesM
VPGPLGGVGLRNVEQRLASCYGSGARLSLQTADNGETAAEIWLPVQRPVIAKRASAADRARA